MKGSDIVLQLIKRLSPQTGLFNSTSAITAVSRSGTTVTVDSTAAPQLSVGETVILLNIGEIVPITNTTINGNVLTCTTSIAHDLTTNFTETVLLLDGDTAEYNGQFNLIDAVNRFTFQFDIGQTPNPAGPGANYKLIEFRDFSYNGAQVITGVNPTQFTFEVPSGVATQPTILGGATNLPIVDYAHRVTRAVDFSRFRDAYQENALQEYWLCVVPGVANASRDRNVTSDAIYYKARGNFGRLRLIENFDVFCVANATGTPGSEVDTLVGGVRDSMDDVATILYRCLLGWTPPSNFAKTDPFGVVLVNHDTHFYDIATYAHRFTFEISRDILDSESARDNPSRAFRDIDNIVERLDDDYVLQTTRVNLDDLP